MTVPQPDREEGDRFVRLTLEIHASAEPIHGSVADQLDQRPFDGWLELVRLIEDSRTRARDAAGGSRMR